MDHEQFWSEYYDRVKRVIERRVRAIRSNTADTSEIALSAINSFLERKSLGKFPGLDGPGLDGAGLDNPGLDNPGQDSPGLDSPGLDSPGLDSKEQLWKLLKTIAIRKANDAAKHFGAMKRGGATRTMGEADYASADEGGILAQAVGTIPDGSDEVVYRDLVQNLLATLESTRDKDIVLLRLQGASLAVIAECLEVSTRTVRRILEDIERDWLQRVKQR